MINILRVYTADGECFREPRDIIRILTESTEPIELDWADSRGHVRMATNHDLAGQSAYIEGEPFEIPSI